MKRKIVKQGSATMTISLPAPWIKKYSLKEGDEININEKGKILEITTEKAQGQGEINIDITKHGYFDKQDLSHLYILGYDKIKVNFKEQKTLEDVKERIQDCIGYEIFDQSENTVEIRSVSSELEEEYDNILRKVFLILKEMSEKTYEAMKKKEFARLKQIQEMEIINNKFTSFLLRLLSKKGYKKPNRTLQEYDMIQNIERIADEYKYICQTYENKKSANKEVLEILKEINELYNLFYNMHYQFTGEKKIAFKEKRKKIEEKIKNNYQKEPILSHHLIALTEKIRNASGSFLAVIMD